MPQNLVGCWRPDAVKPSFLSCRRCASSTCGKQRGSRRHNSLPTSVLSMTVHTHHTPVSAQRGTVARACHKNHVIFSSCHPFSLPACARSPCKHMPVPCSATVNKIFEVLFLRGFRTSRALQNEGDASHLHRSLGSPCTACSLQTPGPGATARPAAAASWMQACLT